MKRLLIIVPNLRLGGQERVAVNTAEIMSDDYEVTLLTFDNFEPAYEWNGSFIDIDVPAKPGKLIKVINVIRRAMKVKSIKCRLGIDFCMSFGESANIINVLSRSRGKVLTSIRGYSNLLSRPIDKFIYGHSDKVICCSKEIKDKYDKLFIKYHNSEALYNPYDITRLKVLGNEKIEDFVSLGYTIITHGRLEKVKNYARLIKAISIVKEKIENVRLVIIGEGSEKNNLEELVRDLGLENNVSLPGFQSNPFAYLAKSDLYVLSSLNEGFPNALVEGMIFLPVVAVDCKSGPREILNDEVGGEQCSGFEEAKYGILVKQTSNLEFKNDIDEDDDVLAEAIANMLLNKDKLLEYKRLSAKRVNDFSVESYRIKLVKILEV